MNKPMMLSRHCFVKGDGMLFRDQRGRDLGGTVVATVTVDHHRAPLPPHLLRHVLHIQERFLEARRVVRVAELHGDVRWS